MEKRMNSILSEVQKVIVGKKDVIEKVLMAILANGHILLDDVPGVGKTTMALALSRALGLTYNRIQFTPDVLPSDIVGFSIFDKESGKMSYMPGVVTNTNLLLADEINRTSSKTQSALLEAMEEKQVTVDGQKHPLDNPFIVIATENHVGAAGTQLLPHAQLDRFLVRLSIGYPDFESEMAIIRDRCKANPLDSVQQVLDLETLLEMMAEVENVTMKDEIISYIIRLTVASRESEYVELGISPRGALAVSRMARACAYIKNRDYVIPEDVQSVFSDVCAHRILLSQAARNARKDVQSVMKSILDNVSVPFALE